jgi:putative transposase
MHNHFHLLLRLADPADLSPLMAGLLRAYVHYFHRRYRFVGHLWQGRFKSCAVEAEDYLLSCGRYIERNPLAATIVEKPWQWRWSSCRVYALGERDVLVSRNPYYRELASEPRERQRRWREFLLDADEREAVICREDWVAGSETFRRQMEVVGGRPRRRGRGRPCGPALAVRTLFSQLDAKTEDR